MIKKLLLSTVVLSLSGASAFAADLPSRRAPPVYIPPPVPVFTWTGAYIGANAGYAFDNKSSYRTTGDTPGAAATLAGGVRPGFAQTSDSGFTGGLQIGYNYQFGSSPFGSLPVLNSFGGGAGGGLVAGVEADAAYTDLRNASLIGAGATTSAFSSRTDYVGTVRGRLGVAFGNALLYGTGGFAYGGVRENVAFTGVGAGAGSLDKIKTGYAYGGGIEYAIPTSSFVNVFNAGAVTLKAEYIHYDLGTDTLGAGAYTTRIKTEGNIVRGGINYKFDSFSPAAVVARY